MLVGEVRGERRLPRRVAGDVDAIQVRVAIRIYGAGVEDVVHIVPRRETALAAGERVLLLLADDPWWTPDYPNRPQRLYHVLENGRVPLRADGTVDLSGFELPHELAPRAEVALAALLPWIERARQSPRPRPVVLAAADPERFFAQPRLAGTSRAPDDRAVTFELRTRSGVHAIRLGPVRRDPADAAAAELCARIAAALPGGPGGWAVP